MSLAARSASCEHSLHATKRASEKRVKKTNLFWATVIVIASILGRALWTTLKGQTAKCSHRSRLVFVFFCADNTCQTQDVVVLVSVLVLPRTHRSRTVAADPLAPAPVRVAIERRRRATIPSVAAAAYCHSQQLPVHHGGSGVGITSEPSSAFCTLVCCVCVQSCDFQPERRGEGALASLRLLPRSGRTNKRVRRLGIPLSSVALEWLCLLPASDLLLAECSFVVVVLPALTEPSAWNACVRIVTVTRPKRASTLSLGLSHTLSLSLRPFLGRLRPHLLDCHCSWRKPASSPCSSGSSAPTPVQFVRQLLVCACATPPTCATTLQHLRLPSTCTLPVLRATLRKL